MKSIKIIVICSSFFFLLNAEAQKQNKKVLLKIGGKKTTVDDFLNSYNKNRTIGEDSQTTSISEYLDLYINFRLKVIEAKSLKMDTIGRLKNELDGYFKKLAEPFLFDEKTNEHLLSQAYERSKIDIRVSHILVRCAENAKPEDTLKSYQKIIELRQRVENGEDFELLATKHSDDLSARNQNSNTGQIIKKGNAGDLGYFSVFDMVYPFENAAYETPVGEICQPVRTRFGYHILKVTDKHEAIGKVKLAHIFLSDPNPEKIQEGKIKAIHKKLQEGTEFEKLALQYSEDETTKHKGGVLPIFRSNQMNPEFYLGIFTIDSTSGYSEPIKTANGWHIIKLVKRSKPSNFNNEKSNLFQEIKRDSRSEQSKTNRLEQIKDKNGFKAFSGAKDDFFEVIDTNLLLGKWDLKKADGFKKNLLKIGKQLITQSDFAQFIDEHQQAQPNTSLETYYQILYDNFVTEVCEKYFYDNIENNNPTFKKILNEYRDGILLFELSNLMVWQKSMNDEDGLNAYFVKNHSKYSNAELKDIEGIVISDYQDELEQNWIKKLRAKYSININKKILSQINE